jgi:hypothetical protein
MLLSELAKIKSDMNYITKRNKQSQLEELGGHLLVLRCSAAKLVAMQ